MKSCLKKNQIDVPDVMTAFEPFNDDMSRLLCEYVEIITYKCVFVVFFFVKFVEAKHKVDWNERTSLRLISTTAAKRQAH